ncbi:MlaD family protein [Aldersonia kunmingensis]|uniref:MlaD family protein n=1 Tax=Aldersonia kunmingensis TaxID=408066 RepID=UPI000A052D6A|nr:MlaD family protein [Aldersonia kunmingensis]
MTTARVTRALAVTAIVTVLAGCGFNPADVPVPGSSTSGPTYRVRIEFANALNLPDQAKVIANGARIGTLREVSVVEPTAGQPGHVIADIDIDDDVRLPADTTAQLRQNTLLGDIFIGLDTPAGDAAATIPDNGTIPLQQTEPATQVEDLMATVSTFVTGGAFQRFQDIVDSTNSIMPEDPVQTRQIFDTLGQDTRDLANNLNTVDALLTAVETDLHAALDNPDAIATILSERGAAEIPVDANSLVQVLGIIGGLGIIAESIQWMAPFLAQADAATQAFAPLLLGNQPLDTSSPSNMKRIQSLLRDKIIPFAEGGPTVNIKRVQVEPAPGQPVARDIQVDQIVDVLRMIGIVR